MVQGLLFKLGVHAEVHSRIAINIDDVNNVVLDKRQLEGGREEEKPVAVATLNIT